MKFFKVGILILFLAVFGVITAKIKSKKKRGKLSKRVGTNVEDLKDCHGKSIKETTPADAVESGNCEGKQPTYKYLSAELRKNLKTQAQFLRRLK